MGGYGREISVAYVIGTPGELVGSHDWRFSRLARLSPLSKEVLFGDQANVTRILALVKETIWARDSGTSQELCIFHPQNWVYPEIWYKTW